MIIPDTNLLIYAYSADARHHREAREWWEETLKGQRPVGLAAVVVLGFLRLTTNPRVVQSPLPVCEATKAVRLWLQQPCVTPVTPGPGHYDLFCGLLDAVGVAGSLTTDAHIAALALEWQAEVATCDNDFDRFRRVRWFNPLARA